MNIFTTDDKVLVYPVDKGNLDLIESTENYPFIHINKLISPKSWGYDGESYKCSGGTVIVCSDFENELEDCTVVWIVDSWHELDFKEFVEPMVRKASLMSKRIVCSRSLSQEEKMSFNDINVEYVERLFMKPVIKCTDRVQYINTPIVFIMSPTEFCNQFYIETAIKAEMQSRKYNPLLISSLKEAIVFDCHAIPEFMFCNDYNENEKILALNQYVRKLEIQNRPDIIIIGIPGVAMTYGYQYSSDFGVIAYEISEAIKSDFAIFSSPCLQYDMDYFKNAEKNVRNRLGVDIDVHSLSCYALDFYNPTVKKNISYLTVNEPYVCDIIKTLNYNKLINLNNKHGIEEAVDRIVLKLSEENEFQVL